MPKEPRLHLPFLDGLRGLACLYVLLYHETGAKLDTPGTLSWPLAAIYRILDEGRHSVVFFIVLSGYSLMLPIARGGSLQLVGGFRDFVRRRGRRILPPYYGALVVSVALIVVYNLLSARLGTAPTADAALSLGSVLSHVFLVHNLSWDWVFRINGPMWSVATEWQIYFIFALVLLPLARRIGMVPTIALAWLLTSAPAFLLPDSVNLFWASPWFLGSFALGMYGAHLTFSPEDPARPRRRLPWGALAWASFAVVFALAVFHPAWRYPVIDFCFSVFALCWINACAQLTLEGKPSRMLAFLGSRPVVYLGAFSYSLYLVQHPALRVSEKLCNKLHLSADANLLVHLVLVTPIVMAVAWVFSELFERPFTRGGVLLPALKRRFARGTLTDQATPSA